MTRLTGRTKKKSELFVVGLRDLPSSLHVESIWALGHITVLVQLVQGLFWESKTTAT